MRYIRIAALFFFVSLLFVNVPTLAAAPDDVDGAIKQLTNADPQARIFAARDLGWWHDPRGVPPLINALHDKLAAVRVEAVAALGKIADPRAVVRAAAAHSLANINEQDLGADYDRWAAWLQARQPK